MLTTAILFALVAQAQVSDYKPPVGGQEILQTPQATVYSPPKSINVRARSCPDRLRHETRQAAGQSTNDPKAVLQCFAKFPRQCMRNPNVHNAVELIFDVAPDGVPENIRVVRSSDRCFEKPAAKGVAGWRYPESAAGHEGLTTIVTFHLDD